ncbi:MAG: exodeoxyribonuclease V subunit gamma [Myxococcota bacterium]
MLFVYRSNRVEELARQLADLLRSDPSDDPMAPELVAVQGRGMERWLSHALATELGATANIEFPFPAKAIEGAIEGLLGTPSAAPIAEGAPDWDADHLAWAVLASLQARLEQTEFAPLRRWLARDDLSVVRRREWLLAQRIGDLFDRYAAWRPDLMREWDAGRPGELAVGDHAWQPVLWRDVRGRIAAQPLYVRLGELQRELAEAEAFGADPFAGQTLPGRRILFSISTLPELHLQAARLLARTIDVHLFALTPSQELWHHVRSRREIARELCLRKDEATAQDLNLEEGNPLLASLGRLGRDFQVLLEGQDGSELDVQDQETAFVDPAPQQDLDAGQATLLHVLQSDVLHLRHRGRRVAPGLDACPPVELPPGDDSLRVHVCHGPVRQVEVLRDELLGLLDADPTLQPRDIVVMSPDIETFAPLVEAVFAAGGRDEGAPLLRVSVADRTLRRDNAVADALLRVLTLARSRATASEVLELLELEPVRRRFELQPDDVPQIQRWVRDAGVRWGIDADHRQRERQQDDPQNTWQFGLDRLLLGVAMPDEDGRLFGGVLPVDGLEGSGVALLGRFAAFASAVFDTCAAFREPADLATWQQRLADALQRLTATTARASWLQRQVLDEIEAVGGRIRAVAAGQGPVGGPKLEVDAIQTLLDGRFAVAQKAKGLLTGDVTFCALVPLRSIPFRVVCLLGMDDATFPRRTASSGFDLVAAKPRVGDRSSRDDDRALFLDALLAARDKVRIFYAGRDTRRNHELPPAVPVAELLDVAEASARSSAGSIRRLVVVEHTLQPFSPRQFGADGRPPQSFDARMARAATRLLGQRLTTSPPLFAEPLPPPDVADEAGAVVTIDELVRFFQNPAQFVLRQRLGLYPADEEAPPDDRDPIELDGLQVWAVGNDVVQHSMAGQSEDVVAAAVRARGQLPPGALGQVAYHEVAAEVAQLLERLPLYRQGAARSVVVELTVPGLPRLFGTLPDVWQDGLAPFRYGKRKPVHELELWIRHLALTHAEPHLTHRSAFVSRSDDVFTLGSLAPDATTRAELARTHLTELLRLYVHGQTLPLALLPAGSAAFARAWRKERDESLRRTKAWNAANTAWLDGRGGGDGTNAALAQVFAEFVPWRAGMALPGRAQERGLTFEALALQVWGPLLDAPAADQEGA